MLLGGPWYFTEIYKQNPSIELGWFLFPADYEKFMRRLTPYQAYKARLEQKDAQLNALKMQIQPQVVTLKQELDHIREYFTIISIRYNGLYHLEIMAADEELKLYIPKLILQPMVENAVKHGLRSRKGPGRVMEWIFI